LKQTSVTSLSDGIDGRQLETAVLIAGGYRAKDAAAKVGVSAQTISAWRAKPEFQEVVDYLKTESLKCARDSIRALALDAAVELKRLMEHGNSDHVRLQAALAILRGVGVIDERLGKTQLWRRLGSF
jgi:hypothetical protein